MIAPWLFCLASLGLTCILVDSEIFHPVRQYVKSQYGGRIWSWLESILSCHQCAGFWCGVFVALVSWLVVMIPSLSLDWLTGSIHPSWASLPAWIAWQLWVIVRVIALMVALLAYGIARAVLYGFAASFLGYTYQKSFVLLEEFVLSHTTMEIDADEQT